MAALISYRNTADTAAVTGPALAGFPLSNLKTRRLSTRWRTSSASELVCDLGMERTVRVVALLSHNAPLGFRARIFSSLDGVSWALAGINVIDDVGVPGLAQNFIFAIPAGVYARYIKIETPAVAPHFQAGRLWIGDAVEVPYGADSDWTIVTRERGTVDESEGLEVYPNPKPRGRELRMNFTTLDEALAFGADSDLEDTGVPVLNVPSFQDLHTYAGAIGEVIALPRSNWIWPRRVGIYGRLSDDSLSIRHDTGPSYATSVRVIEER